MLGATTDTTPYFQRVAAELLRMNPAEIHGLADAIFDCYQRSTTVFICGNGGSASNASHLCEDLGKGTLKRPDFDNDSKKRLRVISLTDNAAYLLAWGNDEGFDRIFLEQLKNLARPGDLLIAISGSGNSANVLRAVEWSNAHGLTTWACTGYDGGTLRRIAQHTMHCPLDDMGIVESLHNTAFHWIVDHLHARIAQA